MADNPKQKNNKVRASREIDDRSHDRLAFNLFGKSPGKERPKRNIEDRLSNQSGSFLPDIHVRTSGNIFIDEITSNTDKNQVRVTSTKIEHQTKIAPEASIEQRGESTIKPADVKLDDSVANGTDRDQLIDEVGQFSEVNEQDLLDSDDELVTQKTSKAKRNFGSCCGKNESDEEKSNQMTIEESKTFVQDLIKTQEELYHKKFAFARGRFQECIPNPDPMRPNEMITVQLVNRIFKELE